MDEIMEQLTDLLRSYRHYHLNSTDETWAAEDRRAAEEVAGVAYDTFRAMFVSRLHEQQFLVSSTEAEVVGEFRDAVQQFYQSAMSEPQVIPDADACSNALMDLTSEQNSSHGPATWPYIRKIKSVLFRRFG